MPTELSKSPRPDVPRYYRVSTRFWEDEKSAGWPESVQILALYLLTNKHRTLEGLFVLPIHYIAADLKKHVHRIQKGIELLEHNGFLAFDRSTNLMLIRNALKYQQPDSENVVKGAIRRIKDLPQSVLLVEFLRLAKLYCLRTGLSASAQSFPPLLELQLGHLFQHSSQQGSELLNLNPNLQSKIDIKNTISNLESRLDVERAGDRIVCTKFDSDEERKEIETRKKFPHLAQTTGFESVGQIRHKGKSR